MKRHNATIAAIYIYHIDLSRTSCRQSTKTMKKHKKSRRVNPWIRFFRSQRKILREVYTTVAVSRRACPFMQDDINASNVIHRSSAYSAVHRCSILDKQRGIGITLNPRMLLGSGDRYAIGLVRSTRQDGTPRIASGIR